MRPSIYSTCPQSKDIAASKYAGRVTEVARWSEQAGAHGILVYTDNGIVDPWLVAQRVIESTERLRPLVAVQPVYMHPYTVAKLITSFAYLHGCAIDLNMLAGGFRNDLLALGDETEQDLRYDRTVEYTKIVTALLNGEVVTLEGGWHRVKGLKLSPPLPPELAPRLLISGSSPAGMAAARAISALAVRYPKPVDEEIANDAEPPSGNVGMRVGVIGRSTDQEAWRVARERFPDDRRGELRHQSAMKVSDSQWHRQLSGLEHGGEEAGSPYWLGPLGAELARYMAQGFAYSSLTSRRTRRNCTTPAWRSRRSSLE